MNTIKTLKSKKFAAQVKDFFHRLSVVLVMILMWTSAATIYNYSDLPGVATNVMVVGLFIIGLIQMVQNLRPAQQ